MHAHHVGEQGRTVAENLNMNGALLSRFDLVFILLDKADESMDRLLSAHVMALHNTSAGGRDPQLSDLRSQLYNSIDGRPDETGFGTLADRLKVHQNDRFEPLPPPLLRKYIGYARKYVRPELDPGAVEVRWRTNRRESSKNKHVSVSVRSVAIAQIITK